MSMIISTNTGFILPERTHCIIFHGANEDLCGLRGTVRRHKFGFLRLQTSRCVCRITQRPKPKPVFFKLCRSTDSFKLLSPEQLSLLRDEKFQPSDPRYDLLQYCINECFHELRGTTDYQHLVII
jgi:hypothetical protein